MTEVIVIPEGAHSVLGPSSAERWLNCEGGSGRCRRGRLGLSNVDTATVRTLLATTLLLGGCSTLVVKPIVGVEHTSSISQHFGPAPTNYGCDQLFGGLRLRTPDARVQLDLTEGYSPEGLDSPAVRWLSEARLTVELL